MQKSKKYFIAGLIFTAIIFAAKIAYSQDADYFYYKANSSLTSGKMSEAIKYYNQAIKNDPSFFEAYMGLSIAYRESGEYDKALDSVNAAIKLQPDYYQAYYNLGLILEKQNRLDEAIKAYEKFLKGVPGAAKFSDAKQRILKLKESE
jgi:tetratricopeptide (TPR) repeat protein